MAAHDMLPKQWIKATEMTARVSPANAPLSVVAAQIVSRDVRVVPLRRSSDGLHWEPVPMHGVGHDAWHYADQDVTAIQRNAARWRKADAIGVRFSYAEHAHFVLDPDERTLSKFVEFVSMRA